MLRLPQTLPVFLLVLTAGSAAAFSWPCAGDLMGITYSDTAERTDVMITFSEPSSANARNDDTTTMRANTETLP